MIRQNSCEQILREKCEDAHGYETCKYEYFCRFHRLSIEWIVYAFVSWNQGVVWSGSAGILFLPFHFRKLLVARSQIVGSVPVSRCRVRPCDYGFESQPQIVARSLKRPSSCEESLFHDLMVDRPGFVPQTPETASGRKPNRWLPKNRRVIFALLFSSRRYLSIIQSRKNPSIRMSFSLIFHGGSAGIRTRDLGLKRALLYLLSYQSMV